MNKKLHRLVFCKARHARVAVHESAKGAPKGSGAKAAAPGAAIATLLAAPPAQAHVIALLALLGTTIDTPGPLNLSADTLLLGTQTTEDDVRISGQSRDLMYQRPAKALRARGCTRPI